jgi:hypothetical protein
MVVDQATRQGYASAKHRLRLVLALRVKRVDAKPRSRGGGLYMPRRALVALAPIRYGEL